jgi:hypothetical protein
MNREYFVVEFKDGTHNDFNKKCEQVKEFGGAGHMICFNELLGNGTYRVMSIINIDEIKLINMFRC